MSKIDRVNNQSCATCLQWFVSLHLRADNRNVFALRRDHVRERNTADVDVFATSRETSLFDLEGRDDNLTGFVAVSLLNGVVQQTDAAHNLQVVKTTQRVAGHRRCV